MSATPYTPGPVLLAAQQHLLALRKRNDALKREIEHLMTTAHYTYEQARQQVQFASTDAVSYANWREERTR